MTRISPFACANAAAIPPEASCSCCGYDDPMFALEAFARRDLFWNAERKASCPRSSRRKFFAREPSTPFPAFYPALSRDLKAMSKTPSMVAARHAGVRMNGPNNTDRQQDDNDNHANQLNPNNDAYWQSRGEDERPDNWEDE